MNEPEMEQIFSLTQQLATILQKAEDEGVSTKVIRTVLNGCIKAYPIDADSGFETAKCRHCGYDIILDGKRWLHPANGHVSRGCYSASFDRDGTWDKSIDKRLLASPPKGF